MKDLILLHGAIGESDQLSALKEQLTSKNIAVYTFNFSGHGKQPFQDNFSIEVFASELQTFIVSHALNQPSVFGYSMGGFVALYFAFTKPGLLNHIITLGTKFDWSPETAQKEIKMLNPVSIEEKVPKFAESLKQKHGSEWKKLLDKTAQMMIELGNAPRLTSSSISNINNKVLIGIADRDAMVSLTETTEVLKALKNGSMFMLPNSKHPIETVNINLLSKIIEDFIN